MGVRWEVRRRGWGDFPPHGLLIPGFSSDQNGEDDDQDDEEADERDPVGGTYLGDGRRGGGGGGEGPRAQACHAGHGTAQKGAADGQQKADPEQPDGAQDMQESFNRHRGGLYHGTFRLLSGVERVKI